MKNEKDNKNASLPDSSAEAVKEKFYTNPWLVLVAAILIVVIVFSILVGIEMNNLSITIADLFEDEYSRGDLWAALLRKVPEPIDFMEGDLSRFIEFSSDKYKNYEVSINVPPISEAEIEDDITKILSSKRGSADGGYKYELSTEISPGDMVYFRYVAYEYDEKGQRVEIPFLNNLTVKDDELKLSGGIRVGALIGIADNYLPGLESALVGIVPSDYQCNFAVSKGGALLDSDNTGDVAYVTATFVKERDGKIYENYPIRIELDDERLEDKWGDGILSYLSEKNIGLGNKNPITLNATAKDKDGNEVDERITYLSATVNYVTRGCEDDSVLTIETFFPYDYEKEEYRSKSFYVDIFFTGVTSYESPELNEEFITETLGIAAESLDSYEGEDIVAKFRSYRKTVLTETRNAAIKEASENAVWEYLKSVIDVKEYPRREINRISDDYYYSVQASLALLQEAGATYDSIDTYAIDYFGLEEGASWYEHIMNLTENEVKEKLIFYTIIKMENLIPTEEEFKALYRSELEKDYKYAYGKTSADFETAEQYEQALSAYEKEIIENKGSLFYKDAVYYYYATDTILSYATIKNTYGS